MMIAWAWNEVVLGFNDFCDFINIYHDLNIFIIIHKVLVNICIIDTVKTALYPCIHVV